jgi:GNAT superfamily N-acetyltransferase
MSVVYRTARADELARAQELVAASINDLTERHGFGPMASARPPQFQLFSLQDDPDGLWIADDSGETVGFAFSWVCGDLWFLAELFVSPARQGQGIGNELLKRTLHQAQKAGATSRALITFTFNRVSQALYIRHGIFPRMPIYFFSVPSEKLQDRLQEARYRSVPIADLNSDLDRLAQIDMQALGVSRRKHHKFLIADSANKCHLLYKQRDCIGYAYVGAGGHVGPLAVNETGALGPAFRTALGLAVDGGASQVSAFLPGTGEAALGIAVQCGMRITFPMLLMSSCDFGNWSQYLPRNPGFM